MKYKIWNKTDSLITPIGEVLTAEQVIAKYPMAGIEGIDFIICDAPISLGVFMEFTQTKDVYKPRILEIASTPDMTESEIQEIKDAYDASTPEEILEMISFMEANPPPAEPTAEERIAAALEFQNLLSLDDVEV